MTSSVKIFKKFPKTVERFRSDLSAVIIINAREIKLPRKNVQIFVGDLEAVKEHVTTKQYFDGMETTVRYGYPEHR